MLIELDKSTSNLWGSGNPGCASLYWQVPLSISFQRDSHKRYVFRTAEAQLRFPKTTRIAEARTEYVNRLMKPEDGRVSTHLTLDFGLDVQQIYALEQYREGGSVKLDLWIDLHIDEHRPVIVASEAAWELENLFLARLQEGIEISQSDWIEHVLPGIGYGKIHIVEFPAVPLESCQALDHSFQSLKQAEEKHRLGYYDDAVGKCRMALEKFFDLVSVDPSHTESRKIPVLKKSWEKKMGKATYDWLNSTLGAIKDASNPPHHSPNPHYDQLESQMILAITTAVVAYVARASETEEPDS